MNNFWDSDDNVSEFDLMQDSIQEVEEQPIVEYEDIEEQVIESIQQESAFELDEEETCIIYNARLRLEQARLYEMLINHNIFDGIEADEQAIQNVQQELKEYIVYRLEILLGLRKPKPQQVEQPTINDERLNDIEVDFLKQLAYKGTRGASVQQVNQPKPIVASTPTPLKSVVKDSGKQKTLKSMGTSKKVVKTATKIVEKQPVVTKAPVKSKKVAKVDKPTVQRKITSGGGGRQMTPQEAEALAREDLELTQNKKKWGNMSAQEKSEEVRKVNARHAKTKVVGAIPIPNTDQIEMQLMTRQANVSQGSGGKISQFNTMVANIIAQNKQKLGD